MKPVRLILVCVGLMLATLAPVAAQTQWGPPGANPRMNSAEVALRAKLNAWTIGLAGGLLEGAPIRFATDIARVVDDGEDLHVLPIVTRGPQENLEALLYLRGVDAAIINSDALEQYRTLVPNIDQRISYVLNLFPSELHIFVRPEINSLADLKGKKVNFNTPGTTAAYSGPLIFKRLGIEVDKTFIPHPAALEQMRKSENGMAAVVFITSKPVDAFARGRWDPGFKFLPVETDDPGFYTPSVLTSKDYPQLIQEGHDIPTISVPTVLAAYNWPKGSAHYLRLARFVDHLFTRLERLHEPGFHPAWKDVNLAAQVPGMTRFVPAQEWIDRHQGEQKAADTAAPQR